MPKVSLISLLAVCCFCFGCAISNRDNTPTLNLVREHLVPESRLAKVAAFPAVLPVKVVAAAVDGLVLHPPTVIDDAARDTKAALWRGFDWKKRYATECFRLPLRTVATPLLFAGSFLVRSAFDVAPSKAEPPAPEPPAQPEEGAAEIPEREPESPAQPEEEAVEGPPADERADYVSEEFLDDLERQMWDAAESLDFERAKEIRDKIRQLKDLEREMRDAAQSLDFERAAEIRDKIEQLRKGLTED